MRKVLRRTKSRSWLAILIHILIMSLFIFVCLYILRQSKNDYKLDLENAREQIQSKIAFVYEAKEDIKAGQIITKEDLEYVEVYSSQGEDYYINEEHFGMISKIDIRKGTYLLEDMLAKDMKMSNLREIEYNVLFPSSNIEDSDYVDVRIVFPNGEDYIILSKKNLKNLNKETGNCYLWLSEKEILDMAGAVVDTYMYPGSKVYTSKYLEPSLQEASLINYKPNLSNLELINKNTNILRDMNDLDEIIVKTELYKENQRFRKELEFRLEEFYSKTDQDFTRPIGGIGSDGEVEIEYGG